MEFYVFWNFILVQSPERFENYSYMSRYQKTKKKHEIEVAHTLSGQPYRHRKLYVHKFNYYLIML